jgi:hypothetical protein
VSDPTHARLMEGVARLVKMVRRPGSGMVAVRAGWTNRAGPLLTVETWGSAGTDGDDLTPGQILALNVLFNDPATLPQALADYLMDMGHEPDAPRTEMYAVPLRELRWPDGRPFADSLYYARAAEANGIELRTLGELASYTAAQVLGWRNGVGRQRVENLRVFLASYRLSLEGDAGNVPEFRRWYAEWERYRADRRAG